MAFERERSSLTSTRAVGQPTQRTVTAVRQAGSQASPSVTDRLGRQTTHTDDGNRNLTSVTRLAGTADVVTTTMTSTTCARECSR